MESKLIGFSSIAFFKDKGLFCVTENDSSRIMRFDLSSSKIFFDRIKEKNITLLVTDCKKFYADFSFLGYDLLKSIQIRDCKLFFNTYKNILFVDINKIAKEYYQIDNQYDQKRIETIWKIQKEESWGLIPTQIQNVYVQKDSLIAFRIGSYISTLPQDILPYESFMQEFLLSLSKLENIGIVDQSDKLVIPQYEYDHVVTGRLVNSKPFSFQTISKEKFLSKFKSRFGDNGKLVIADWSNIDFSVAAALSKTKLTEENKDPYVLIAKKLLSKDKITQKEREECKLRVMQILYGSEENTELNDTYPNIFKMKKEITEKALNERKVTSFMGKVRYFDTDEESSITTKAFNNYIQMGTADLFKRAIIEGMKLFTSSDLKSTLIPALVYDSFGFDIHNDETEQTNKVIEEILTQKCIPEEWKEYVNFEFKTSDIYK